jgi:hypothetical protein
MQKEEVVVTFVHNVNQIGDLSSKILYELWDNF